MTTAKGISVPEQLDKAFFANALQNGLHEQRIEIRRIKFSPGSSEGENYCTNVYRVLLLFCKNGQLDPDLIYVIVKVLPSSEEFDFLPVMNIFDKEKWLLMEIVPQLEILLNDIRFAPRFYYATSSPLKTIVLEDMDRFGFEMADREIGLDECHTKFVLKKLAQFHASSMIFARKRPSMMLNFNRGILDPNGVNPSTKLYKLLYKHLKYEINLASEWEGFEEIAKKMQNFHNDFKSRLLACQMPRDGELKVLNHGELWMNNLLFKYDPHNNPMDSVFIDFQLSVYGSPGIDLHFFLFSSVQLEVLKKWKSLLEVYYTSLKKTLTELGYDKIPTYEDIEEEFKQTSPYGFFTLIGPMTLFTMDKELSKGNNFENLAASEEKTKVIFSSEKLHQRLKYSLIELDKLGALDR